MLTVLHAAGQPLSPGQVRDHLDDGLAYTTVVTILSRLHAKGVLHRHKAGRAYLYAPVADEPGLAARRMARVLDAEADREAVLSQFSSPACPVPTRNCCAGCSVTCQVPRDAADRGGRRWTW